MRKQESLALIRKFLKQRYMIKFRINIIVFSLLAVFFASSCTNIYEDGKDIASVSKTKIKSITVKELKAKIESEEDFLLIDVRQNNEYLKGNIEGSYFISRGDLEFKILNDEFWEEEYMYTPEKDADIIIYCKAGDRGALATESLMKLGFTNVKNLEGGIIAWDPEFESSQPQSSDGGGCGG